MAAGPLTDAKVWMGGYDLSGDVNGISSNYAAEMKDVTSFGSGGTRVRLGGLKSVTVTHEGMWNGGDDEVDDALFSAIGVADKPVTLCPSSGAVGDVAYTFLANHGSYAPGANIGDIFRFSVDAEGSGGAGLVRGQILHNTTASATGDGTKVAVGAVAAGQIAYASLHVVAFAGTSPTLDVIIESDADASAGGESTRITFTQATGLTAEWQTVAGAITDTYWRVSHTIGGTGSPSFLYVVTLGIK